MKKYFTKKIHYISERTARICGIQSTTSHLPLSSQLSIMETPFLAGASKNTKLSPPSVPGLQLRNILGEEKTKTFLIHLAQVTDVLFQARAAERSDAFFPPQFQIERKKFYTRCNRLRIPWLLLPLPQLPCSAEF